MELNHWLSMASIFLLGAVTPGPSLAVVMKHTVSASPRHGIAAAVSHAAGVAGWALVTIWGLAVVLVSSPDIFKWLTWAGAGYLIWLGIGALRSSGNAQQQHSTQQEVPLWQSARDGLMISMLNPKLALFFLALFPQFFSLSQGSASPNIMVATAAGIDGLWYILVALLLSRGPALAFLQRHSHWFDRISGVIFIGLAFKVISM